MKKITLNLEQIKNKEELYAILKKKMQLKADNLDGMYQYLTATADPMTLTMTGVGTFKNEMGNYAGSFLKIVDKAQKRNPQLKVRLVYAVSEKKHINAQEKASGQEKDAQDKKTSAKQKKEGCPYAKKCGGCNGQIQSYSQELEEKKGWLDQVLGPLGNVDEILPMQNPLHYRHKVHAVFSHDKRGNILAGVYEEKSHRVVDIENCRIENEEAGKVIRTIKEMCRKYRIKSYDEDTGMGFLRHVLIRSSYKTGEMLVVTGNVIFPAKKQFVKDLTNKYPKIASIVMNINDRKTSMVLGDREITLYGKGYIEDELCGRKFRISPKSFYQVNPEQTEKLYQMAIECAGLTGTERVVDAYCGTGTIGIVAAKQAGSVIGVELNRDAVRDARVNAKLNQTDNISFVQGDATRFMAQMAADGEKADVVFLDPPRSGSTEECLDAIDKLSPQKVVYISCNPETLARDVLFLMKKQYRMTACKPVDLFPWTRHVETVCLLSKLHEAKHHVNVRLDMDELDITSAESKATYEEIKSYVAEHNDGMKVSNLYIAQVKAKYGIIERENYNKAKSDDARQPQCPKEKEKAIEVAFEHFKMI